MLDSIHLRLPATSANLGPAFDAAALALGVYLNVEARRGGTFEVSAQGRDSAICGSLRRNLIVDTYTELLLRNRKDVKPLTLHVRNDIPVGKGLGSSAAARLAGVALACQIGRFDWSDEQVITAAAEQEGHPDNVAACWLGGFVVAGMNGTNSIAASKIPVAARWPVLVVIPPDPLPTESAREILPESYPREDVVSNLQNSLLLMAAFAQGRGELLSQACRDHIHQPYRESLCSHFAALKSFCSEDGVLAVTLSGAGPSVLMILDTDSDVDSIQANVRQKLQKSNLAAELILTGIEDRGARDPWFSNRAVKAL